jgi:chromosome segregation ATPase
MDIEKTMQFLLEQQARFDARQAEYETRQAEYEARQAEYEARQARFEERFEERMLQINDILVRVTSAQERTNAILATLAEEHIELAKSHQGLADAQKVTEQNLNALITTVERHITSHK